MTGLPDIVIGTFPGDENPKYLDLIEGWEWRKWGRDFCLSFSYIITFKLL